MFRLAEAEPLPVAKVAGLKKLRTLTGDRQALGAEVSFLGVSARLAMLLPYVALSNFLTIMTLPALSTLLFLCKTNLISLVAFFSLARIWGECSTIHSLPVLFFGFFF